MREGPSVGMTQRRAKLEYKLLPPLRTIVVMTLAGLAFRLLIWFQRAHPNFAFEGKAAFIWLIPPVIIVGCAMKILAWPFRISNRRRKLARLQRYDRLEEFDRNEVIENGK
jgi:hypothetical protein